MPINSRAKGARFERTLARKLKEYGYDCRRGQQYCGANGDADVIGLPYIHIEAKAVEQMQLYKWMAQAKNDAKEGELPAVFHKKNNCNILVTLEFDAFMEKKEPYIKKISEFDAGFEAVFAKIKPAMEVYKKEFEPRIRGLQGKIKTVLEKGAALCTLEEQNKTRLEFCLKDKKQEIKTFKKSSRTVSSYYKNMSGALTDQSFFMDKKK